MNQVYSWQSQKPGSEEYLVVESALAVLDDMLKIERGPIENAVAVAHQ